MVVAVGTARNRLGARAFQELDQIAVIKPLVKWAYRIEHPGQLPWAIQRAAFPRPMIAPGPTYLEIRGSSRTVRRRHRLRSADQAHPQLSASAAAEVSNFINKLERPIFLLGGARSMAAERSPMRSWRPASARPSSTTASGRGAVNERHPLFCGLAGLYTAKPLRALWERCDGVVSFGSRLEEDGDAAAGRQASPRPKCLQINIVGEEMSTTYSGPKIVGSCDGVTDILSRDQLSTAGRRGPISFAAARPAAFDARTVASSEQSSPMALIC